MIDVRFAEEILKDQNVLIARALIHLNGIVKEILVLNAIIVVA
jgi:hypothetical protein